VPLFVLINRYHKPLEDVERVLPRHRAFLDALFERGLYLASGPLVPRTGGLSIVRAESREQVEAILRDDPFVTESITTYEIFEFSPTRTAAEFAPLVR
jgi:uncharacterized protein YciI